MRRRSRWAAAGVVAGIVLASAPVAQAAAHRVVFTISSPLITESSSLVVSTVHPGLVYTANDSGDTATIYVLDASNGNLVGRTTLTGVTAIDFEAMGGGSNGTLVVGDVGDNHAERSSVSVYKIPQPGRGNRSVRPDAVSLRYSNGPRNAESLLYDSSTGRVFVVSKVLDGAKVYRSPAHVFQRPHAVIQPVASAPAIATDATFIRSKSFAVIRTYFGAVVYRYPSWQRVASFDLPPQPQGESVAAPPGGRYLWIGSEGLRSKVLRVRLPDLSKAGSTGSPPTTDTPIITTQTTVAPRHNAQLETIAWLVVSGAGAALAMVVAAILILHRRHRQTLT